MKINDFADAMKNKPNQTQFMVSAVESTCSELAGTEQGRSFEPSSWVRLYWFVPLSVLSIAAQYFCAFALLD
jgi:hypothetical protein